MQFVSDTYTPFPAERSTPFVSVLPSMVRPMKLLAGLGSPEGAVPGVPGQAYKNIQVNGNGKNDLWLKLAGNQAIGWVKIGEASICVASGGGGTSIKEVYSGNGPPVFTPAGPDAFYTDKLSGVGYTYYDGAWEH